MNARSWIAIGAALILTITAALFGISFVYRMYTVTARIHDLQTQLTNTVSVEELREQLETETDKLRRAFNAVDVEKHLLASQAWVKLKAIQEIRKLVRDKSGPVEKLQDAFEDEFGRRIEQISDNPPQYDVGPAPKITSDPLRHVERQALWSTAAGAVSAFNAFSLKEQPLLEQYQREWALQRKAAEAARRRWQTIKDEVAHNERLVQEFIRSPAQHLPSAETLRSSLATSGFVAAVYGVSDGIAFVSAAGLAIAVWLRAILIAGAFPPTQVISDSHHASH